MLAPVKLIVNMTPVPLHAQARLIVRMAIHLQLTGALMQAHAMVIVQTMRAKYNVIANRTATIKTPGQQTYVIFQVLVFRPVKTFLLRKKPLLRKAAVYLNVQETIVLKHLQ